MFVMDHATKEELKKKLKKKPKSKSPVPSKQPKEKISVDLSHVDISSLPEQKAFCMSCSYKLSDTLKNKKGGPARLFTLGPVDQATGKAKKLYQLEMRDIKISAIDQQTKNDKTLRVDGLCKACGKKCSLIIKKSVVFPEQPIVAPQPQENQSLVSQQI